jgi:predicted TIM-barrel fold metal-dependent hydrolase
MSADRGAVTGVVDYLVNAFTPDRRAVWDGALAATGVQVKVRRDDTDSFAEPEAMVERMDELGVDTVLLPTGDVGRHGATDPFDFEHIAARWEEVEGLANKWPGRFAALALLDPERGMAGVSEIRTRLDEPWVVGCYLHTHSWDRRLDHADYYPFYALCAEAGVPAAMQAGTSGGLMASECGRPIGIDRPALYFPEVRFVLSHLGWPWVDEAIAMALKFPNVYLGTGAYPPRHWSPAVRDFLTGPGRNKVVFGTNFPTVGHRHALAQLAELDLDPTIEGALLGGTARTVFTRLSEARLSEGGRRR